MKIIVLGAGMMGQAIAYDLEKYSHFEGITLADRDEQQLQAAQTLFKNKNIDFLSINVEDIPDLTNHFYQYDIAISALPYTYNHMLAQIAVKTKTHFLDLGGNNDIVAQERRLFQNAEQQGITIIPDCGLAPGLTSVITKDIVEQMDSIEYVKIRVGGLPVDPKPPLQYQIVFSPYGLINEYIEDAIVLDQGEIVKKKSMTEVESVVFPAPFGALEAFLTSGGCSTLPFTYRDRVGYLDYKTIRYPGHCEHFSLLLDLGLASKEKLTVGDFQVVPRDVFAHLLLAFLPRNEPDVVLCKVISKGKLEGKDRLMEYTMIDYYDKENKITAMMRTTAYPVSIIAQLINQGFIDKSGVFGSEEIVPCQMFFDELRKREINIVKTVK